MTTAILAPWAKDEVTRLGQQVFRKEILRFGHVKTDGAEFDFTPEFGQQLVEAFQAGVMPTVPLVLADADNRHTQEVSKDRLGGEVIGLEMANGALYGIIRANESTASMIGDNPRIGVSIRALQGRMDNDGKRWPAVLNHVLATVDPVVGGMGNWEPMELSNDVTEVIDLANPAGSEDKENRMPKSITDSLSTEDAEQLFALLGKALGKDGEHKVEDQKTETDKVDDPEIEVGDEDAGEAAETETDEDDVDLDNMSDEQLEALIEKMLSEESESETPEPVKGEVVDGNGETVDEDRELEPVAASNTDEQNVIELARARQEEQALELARMRTELDTANYEKERDRLVRSTGLPPRIIDLARPLLEGNGRTVELSNGKKEDAGKVVRSLLGEIGSTLKALDLSNPAGFAIADEDEDEGETKDRVEFVDSVKKQFRLG
jgi:hypothetical protein